MINFERFELENGLKVIVHQDKSTPIVAFNLLYDVGARDESPHRTGFAHLFEHLMFGGSINIADYDEVVEKAGGQNNAFTSNDITNYYITLPKENLEHAFRLESDRMLSLAFTPKSLEVQRQVVIEEFKQNYLNQPYGDVHLLLRPLAYQKHPYQWPTIGKEVSHIEEATMEEVKNFFYAHYAPNNAILVVAGDVELNQVKALSEKWFGPIPSRDIPTRNLPKEPRQEKARTLKVERDVPIDVIYKAFHMCARTDSDFFATDLISDILSRGNSSRLFKSLVKEQKLFSDIDAFIGGELDEGLFYFAGKLTPGVSMKDAEAGIDTEIEKLTSVLVGEKELRKVKNKAISAHKFSELNVLNKAINLATSELMGDAKLVNKQIELYEGVTAEKIQEIAQGVFKNTNSNTLYYHAK
ncbi:MAG: pitrilysin family protein [Flavobacteriales bacterium]|nr:pitrilysin family protein [Flavobacteriales bacterium]